MKAAIVAAAILLASQASAQTLADAKCLPWTETAQHIGSPMYVGVSEDGQWAWWKCKGKAGQRDYHVKLWGTRPELARIGGRLTTIITSSDPLGSLRTLPRRITVVSGLQGDATLNKVFEQMEQHRLSMPQ